MNKKTSNRIKMILVASLALSFLAFSNETFLFAAAPNITTGTASSITKTSASLDFTLNSNGGKPLTDAGIEYGLTNTYGSSSSVSAFQSSSGDDFVVPNGTIEGETSGATGFARDSGDNLFLADSSNNRIDEFDSFGFFLGMFGFGVATGANQFETCTSGCQAGLFGSGNGQFAGPNNIFIDTNDNIYVSDQGNSRIQKFNSSGVFQFKFGTSGNTEGQFNTIGAVTTDSLGNIYVIDASNSRIQKFNSSGVFQLMFGFGVATGANQFETCTSGCQAGLSGSGNGQFDFVNINAYLVGLSAIVTDSGDNIYVMDSNNNRIQKFNSSGVYQSQFGVLGTNNGEFNLLKDIFIDQYDYIYTIDKNAGGFDRLQKFDSSGTYVSSFVIGGPFGISNILLDTVGNVILLASSIDAILHLKQFVGPVSLTGLTCSTTYHYRAFATNADGTSYGNDQTFDTLPCEPPIVETKSATILTKTSVLLNGLELDDGASASTARGFEYGTSTLYGHTVNLSDVSLSVTGFNAGTGGVATNNSGYFYAPVGGDNSVTISDSSGNFVKKFGWGVETGASQFEICTSSCQGGLLGSNDGQFDFTDAPGAIAVDSSGGVIYVDDLNGLQKFDLSGNFIEKIPTITSVKDMLVVSGTPTYLYTIDGSGIKKYSTDGTFISTLPGGDLSMSLSPDGVIYSVDSSNDHVLYTYPSSGASGVVTFTYPSGFTPIDFPSSITLDPGGNMVIGDVGGEPRIVFATPDSQTKFTVVSAITSTQIFSASGFELTGPVMDMIINVSNRIFLSTLNDGGFSFSPFFFKKLKPISCNTSYHYRAFATNPEGTTYGADQTFTTLACGSSGGGGGPPPPPPVYGCMDPAATNYSSSATADDGSCTYPVGYLGCTDPTADNYNASAIADDGSCAYGGVVSGCTDATANNYNSLATVDDGSCTYGGGGPALIFGCTDSVATNYNILATSDDGSCTYDGGGTGLIPGCTDPLADNYDPLATSDNGTCAFSTSLPPWVPLPVIDIIHTVTGYIDDHPAVHQAVQILAITGIAVPTSLYLFNEWAGVVSLFLRLWNLIPTIFGLRRKRRPWGTVYDSVTKQPLDPVTVVLRDMFGKDISTSITDLDGRYGFWVPEGTYKITANKGDYLFPSTKMAGKDHDELYDNLYFGGEITVKGEDDIINKNIPMDAINFNWNEFEKGKNKKLMKFYSTRDLFLARIAKILFIAGFVSSCVLAVIEPRTLNYVVLGIYVLIFILSIFGIKPKSAGHVIERATRMPLSFGIMKVFSAGLQTEVNHTVISATGKYYLLVPKGRYYIKLLKKTGEDSYEELFTSKPFTARHGYISKVIKV